MRLISYICTEDFSAEFNEDLNGFVLTFKNSGNKAQTQFVVEEDRLDPDFGDEYLERFEEFDDKLTENESDLVDEFVAANKWRSFQKVFFIN